MIKIIPAIDIIDGKCVRLSQGDYNQMKVYNEDPLEVTKAFEDNGIQYLHLVDLDGAKAKHIINIRTLEKIVANTKLKVDFGGGIKSKEDLKLVFDAGANQATIGTIAVTNRELFVDWFKKFGDEKIILGADIKNKKLAVTGWKNITEVDIFDFLQEYTSIGIKYTLCTDINKDGMLIGSSLELYNELSKKFNNLKIIASGGVTSIHEIEELNKIGIYGVVIGKAIYERKINLLDLRKFV